MTELRAVDEGAVPASAPATSRLFVLPVATRRWVLTDNTTLSSTLLIGEISYNLILLCVGDLGPNLEQGERKEENQRTQKAQETQPAMGWWGYLYPPRPVRPVPWTGQTGRSAVSPCTLSHLTVEVLSSKRSLLRDAAMLMKIRF